MLSYTSSLPTGVYLRMETDSVFDTGNFLPAQSANNNGDDTQEVARPAGAIPRDRSVADGGVGVQQAPVSLTVRMIDDTSSNNTLPFAGEPDVSGVAARVNGLTGPEVSNGQLLTVDSVEGAAPGDRHVVHDHGDPVDRDGRPAAPRGLVLPGADHPRLPRPHRRRHRRRGRDPRPRAAVDRRRHQPVRQGRRHRDHAAQSHALPLHPHAADRRRR